MKFKHHQYRRHISQKAMIATVLFGFTLSSCPGCPDPNRNTPDSIPTLNLDTTDLDRFIDDLPDHDNPPTDTATAKSTLAAASRDLKHVTAVINRTIPADINAFMTIHNSIDDHAGSGFPSAAYDAPNTAYAAAKCAIFFAEYVASKVVDRRLINIPLHYYGTGAYTTAFADHCAQFAARTEAFAIHGAGAHTAADYATLADGYELSNNFNPDRDARLAMATNELARIVRELEKFLNKHVFKKT